jgi:hypothetical protein
MMEKKALFIILGGIIILAGGIGTLFYLRIFDPLWNPFRPEPEEVILKMEKKMKDLKTWHSDLKGELKIENKKEFIISLENFNDFDNTDPQIQKQLIVLIFL